MLRSVHFALPLALFALPILVFAQTPNSPTKVTNAKEMTLFDFEGGNFDGWTLEGNCWDK